MALTIPGFVVPAGRYPPPRFHFSKLSLSISCNARSIPKVKPERQLRHTAMKLFLVDECGLSILELPTVVSKKPSIFRSRSTDRAKQALQLFRDSGFTPNQVRKTILRNPSVLTLSVDGQLKPKIDLLKSLGMTGQDVGYVISHQPRILCGSLEKNLNSKILLFPKLFGSKDELCKAIRRRPGLLLYDFQTLQKKIKFMEDMGLLEDQIKELIGKDPMFLSFSTGRIEKNMGFLTGTLGLHPSIVVKYPVLLNFSVQKRMKPRYKVLQYLKALIPSKYHDVGLIGLFYLRELEFTEKFLKGSNEVISLYEGYKKSLDI